MRRILMVGLVACSTVATAQATDWPQWMGPARDGVWPEEGVLRKFPEGGPKVQWRVPVGGGYAGPAVVGDKVYLHDYLKSEGEVANDPGRKAELRGKERVFCFDARTGKEVWKHEYDRPYEVSYPAGPRCTPTVSDGKVYTLGAMGDLYCFEADSGKVLWSKDFVADYKAPVPQWGFCGHPLVEGGRLFCLVGGPGSAVVAFDKDTGEELWKSLSVADQGYCPPTLIRAGGADQLLIWHSKSINSLDPATGESYWSTDLEPSYGMSIAAPMRDGSKLFTTGMGGKSVLLELKSDSPGVTELWRGDRRNSISAANATPLLSGGYAYGCDCHTGQFRCVDLKDGEIVWSSYQPTTGGGQAPHATTFAIRNGDRYFLFAETGELIVAELSPKGYEEIDRTKILEPTGECFGRPVVWSHPAFADKSCFARNDKELVRVSLAE